MHSRHACVRKWLLIINSSSSRPAGTANSAVVRRASAAIQASIALHFVQAKNSIDAVNEKLRKEYEQACEAQKQHVTLALAEASGSALAEPAVRHAAAVEAPHYLGVDAQSLTIQQSVAVCREAHVSGEAPDVFSVDRVTVLADLTADRAIVPDATRQYRVQLKLAVDQAACGTAAVLATLDLPEEHLAACVARVAGKTKSGRPVLDYTRRNLGKVRNALCRA